jgi:dTDP-4-amino-4,6-dideoxygalactose transaminase
MQSMLDAGVSTRRGIMCAHREPAYASLPLRQPLPQSELAQDHGLILPLFPQITAEQQRRVVDALEAALERALRGSGAPGRPAMAGDAR